MQLRQKISLRTNGVEKRIGDGEKTYLIAEIGINHNGSMDVAKKMIDGAAAAGATP